MLDIRAAGPRRPGPQRDDDGGVATEVVPHTSTKRRLKRPRLYKVILLNDDYTTQEFVTLLLMHVFHHSESTAHAIMLNIHQTGAGIAGVYTFEVAETKVQQTLELAQANDYPLQCTMEPADGEDGEGKEEDA